MSFSKKNYIKGFMVLAMITPFMSNSGCNDCCAPDNCCVSNDCCATNNCCKSRCRTKKFKKNVCISKLLTVCELLVNCDAKIAGNLLVCGNETLAGNLAVGGYETIAGDLSVGGSETIVNNLSVGGSETIVNNLLVGGDLTVTGTIFTSYLAASEDLTVTGTVYASSFVGPNGPIGTAAYGYVYALIPQTRQIDEAILFDANGPLSGVTHSTVTNTDQIVVAASGIYSIIFSVSGTEPNQFTIYVNGVAQASTTYGSGAGTQQNTGLSVLTLGAGDIITIRSHSSTAAVTLASVVGGTQANVTASVLITRLA